MSEPLLILTLATLVMVGSMVIPRVFSAWPPWGRALWRVAALAVLSLLVGMTLGSPLRPQFHPEHAGQHFLEQVVEIGWWLMAARGVIGLARLLIFLEGRPRETQIVSDLIAGAIYVATILAVIDFVFAVSISGLLATSGVIAIVLGLALQSTLSDVFSGIAVGIERPYKAGDLLWVEGGIEGHVTEVNWRSTHIATGHNNIAVVPNSIIAKSRLVNRSLPTPIRGDTLEIRVDARVAPERCVTAIGAAALACRLPLAIPPPAVACIGLHGDGGVYEVSFSVPSSENLGAARTELLVKIQRHLRHAGIALAVEGVASVPAVPVPTPAELLAESDLFGVIAPDERTSLANHMTEVWLCTGETLIRQDDPPRAVFIVASGTLEITARTITGERLLHRMSPGENIGAIGLITGAPYIATATALTGVKAYRLDKDAIAAAIRARPELASGLEALAKRGQEALCGDVAAHVDVPITHPEMFLSRLRGFLHLLSDAEDPRAAHHRDVA